MTKFQHVSVPRLTKQLKGGVPDGPAGGVEIFDAGLKYVGQVETDFVIEAALVNQALEDVKGVRLGRVFQLNGVRPGPTFANNV